MRFLARAWSHYARNPCDRRCRVYIRSRGSDEEEDRDVARGRSGSSRLNATAVAPAGPRRVFGGGAARFVPRVREPVDPVYNESYRRQIEVWLRAICRDPNVRLAFGTDGSYTDMEGLIVVDKTVPPDGSPGEKGLATWGLASHEACHHRKTSRTVWRGYRAKMEAALEAAKKRITKARKALAALSDADRIAEADRTERLAHHEAVRLDQVVLPALQAQLAGATKMEKADLLGRIATAEKQRDIAAAAAAAAAAEKAKLMGPNKAAYDAALTELHAAVRDQMRTTQHKDMWNIVEDGRIETWLRVREPFEYTRISLLNRVYPRVPETYQAGGQMRLVPCPDGYVPVDIHGNELEVVTDPNGKRQVVVAPDTELPVFTDRPLDVKRQMRAALLADAVPEFSAHDKDLHPDVRACLDECRPVIDDGVRGDTQNCLDRATDLLDVLERHGMLPDPDDEKPNSGDQSQQQQGGGQGEGGEGGDQGDESEQQQSGGGGQGEESSESDWEQRGDGGGQGEGTSDASGQAEEGEDGGGITKEEREKAEAEGAGSASEEDAKEAADAEERKQKQAAKSQEGAEKSAAAKGDIDGDGWSMPPNQEITSNEKIRANGSEPPPSGHLTTYGNQISAILEDIKTEERGPERRLRSGRIDRRRLPRVPIGDEEVFWREGSELDLDLAVDTVLDLSGSMDGQRQALQDAAVTMSIATRKTQIPMAIYGYDSGYGAQARHYEFQGYGQGRANALGEIGGRANPEARAGGGTPTKEAVEFAHARLRARRESTRLMIVFTDGMPNDGGGESHQAIEAARREGIPVMGVWFRDEHDHYGENARAGMRRMFGGDFVEISQISELPRAFRKRLFEIVKGKRGRSS